MTSKDLRDEKHQQGNQQQGKYKLNSEPRIETASAGSSGKRKTLSVSGSIAEGLPAKSNGLRPRTHGGVIRQLIEQSKAQLAEDEAALQVLSKRIQRTKQGLGNLKNLLDDWEQSTAILRDDQPLLPPSQDEPK